MWNSMGEAYNEGYLAGHYQGWQDALAAARASAGTPARAPDVPPRPRPTPPGVFSRAASTQAASNPALPAAAKAEPAGPRPAFPPMRAPAPTHPSVRATHPSVPAKTAAQLQAEREKTRERREQQNINITLYVASLLLVAAGALFIGAGLPVPLRFAGVCAVTALFYTAGLLLHARAPRLKPAAVAFSGTGLALVPVTGLALHTLVLHHAPLAWLLTSLAGTAAYLLAAVRLESRVLVYLSLTFVTSTAWSGVSVLGGALMWYFTALIGVAAIFTLLAVAKPRWLPPLYLRPLAKLHPYMVPAVALAATVVPQLLERGDYARIMATCAIYFALTSVAPGVRFRSGQFLAARASLTAAGAVAVWDQTGRGSAGLAAAAVLLALQVLLTVPVAGRLPAVFASVLRHRRWQVDAALTFALQLLLTAAFAVGQQLDFLPGLSGADLNLPLAGLVVLALLTGEVLAVRHRAVAEWAPVAALCLAILLADALGAWTLTLLLVAGAAFWLVRSMPATEPLRLHFVLAARLALTVAAPALTAAVVADVDSRFPAAILALCLALVLQQLVTAMLIRRQKRALAAQLSLALFTASGVGTMTLLTLVDHISVLPQPAFLPPAEHYGAIAIGVQLVAALAVGLMLFPVYGKNEQWRPTVAEAVPLSVATAAVPLAFEAVSLQMGNAALMLVAGYLAVTAVRTKRAFSSRTPIARIPGAATHGVPERQRYYWWLCRGAGTVLVLTLFHQVQRDAGPVLVGGGMVTLSTVFAAALSLQLALPLRAAFRGRARGLDAADAGVLLSLQAASMAVTEMSARAFGSSPAPWQAMLTTVLLAGGAAGAGYLLRRQHMASVFVPAALVVLLMLRGGMLAHVEIVLAIFAVFSAAMVVAAGARIVRGAYFAAARALTAALALVLCYDVSASSTAVAVTFAMVFAVQHVIRWLMRHRLLDVPFQQAAVWITLAGQAVLPLAYLAQPFRAELRAADGGRWVLLLSLLLLLLSAVVAGRVFAARGAVYLAVYAALFGAVALGPLMSFPESSPSVFLAAPVLGHAGVALALLGMSLAATIAGILFRHSTVNGVDHWLWLVAAGSFGIASAVLAPASPDWITGAAVLALSAACFAASHVERIPWFYRPAALGALAGAIGTAEGIVGDPGGPWGPYLPWLAGGGTAAAALYAAGRIRGRILRRSALQPDALQPAEPQPAEPQPASGGDDRYRSLVGAAVLGMAAVGLGGLVHSATSWAGAALVTITAVVIWLEVPAAARRRAAELGALAVTAAVQRAALYPADPASGVPGMAPDDNWYYAPGPDPFWPHPFWPDPFWSVQWYVVLAAVLGVLRYGTGQRDAGKLYLGLASGLLSVSGLLVIFSGDSVQQFWVLALFAVLLVAGLTFNERMFVWWGAAGVALCILWAARHYTYVLLAMIAGALIALALWKLSRSKPAGPD